MKLQAKSRLIAFAPPHELTAVIRDRIADAMRKVGFKVKPYDDEATYPTILYFEFESGLWSMSLGEVQSGSAQIFVATPTEATNEALRHFTRNKDWSLVEDVNAMVKRCLSKLQKAGLDFREERPNVIHKLISIEGRYPIPKELK
jgi:hypothetical protein